MANINAELEAERKKICKIAADAGLDFFDTIFELVTYKELNAIAARGGFPTRYPHWRFGMEYEKLSKGYEFGLSKIYELVINTDPCYAYLMEGNEFIDQKLVMAHVYGHCDFFKNNKWFSKTNRKMVDAMANHATRVRRYIDTHGIDVVEDFIDKCLSIENLIDRFAPYSDKAQTVEKANTVNGLNLTQESEAKFTVNKEYMESFINPSKPKEIKKVENPVFPSKPEKDILLFLIHNAPLESWQQDVLSIIREESYYFVPQGMTKIMNEGWASYWHSKLMTEKIMDDSEVIDFADRHSGTMAMAPGGFNPYKVGIELMRTIEQRWDKGQHGMEWSDCNDLSAKKNWDTKAMKGREKIFQVRRDYNDVTFIDEFLTEEFCVDNKLFVYQFNKKTNKFEINTRDFPAIKKQLLFQLTNFGQPVIKIVDANFENRGELLLAHVFEGVELQPDYMNHTLKNLQQIWKRPVNLATVMDKEGRFFRYDGKEMSSVPFSDLPKETTEAS